MKKLSCVLVIILFCACLPVSFAVIVVSDGDIYGTINLDNSDSLIMTGGWVELIYAEDSSSVEIQGTSALGESSGGLRGLVLHDSTMLLFSGGETFGFKIYDNAQAILHGGRVDAIYNYQRPLSGDWPPSYWDKHIEIICKDWSWNELTNLLTGTWADDTAFNIQLVDQTGYHPAITNIEFTIIPEPATLLLITLGAALIRKR